MRDDTLPVNVERILSAITKGGFDMKANNSPDTSKKPLAGKDGKPVPTTNGAKPPIGKDCKTTGKA